MGRFQTNKICHLDLSDNGVRNPQVMAIKIIKYVIGKLVINPDKPMD